MAVDQRKLESSQAEAGEYQGSKGIFGSHKGAEKASEELKGQLSSAPVLRLPNFDQEFLIECDGSGRWIGAVLSQEGRFIAFYSKALIDRTLTKSTYEKEMMALVLAIQHWRPYLLGRKFVVMIDHKSLRSLLQQRITSNQKNWLAKLMWYEFEVKYKAGLNNGAAAALSRRENATELSIVSVPIWLELEGVNQAVRDDPFLHQVEIPPDRWQYINRLGRTGRQGKEGEGCLILAPWEQYFLDELKDLPIEKKLALPTLDPDMNVKIENSIEMIDASVKEAAYHAWLWYYNSINAIGRDKTTLVELANQFSASIGLQEPPTLFRKTALKMGLKGISGIRIRK